MIKTFDRTLLRLRRERAAVHIDDFDFLLRDVAGVLIDRLSMIKKPLPLVVDLGGAHGVLSELLKTRAGTETVVTTDLSFTLAARNNIGLVADEEIIPFKTASLDGVVSNLALHWVNDLPGALIQIKTALKPDGLFMAAVLGGETLRELRQCLMDAEISVLGGASPRVSPFIDLRDMGALMQRAGFALPVVDSDIVTVEYSTALKLMQDLRGMGASNATFNRMLKPTKRAVLMEAARLYHERFAVAGGSIQASFEVIYVIGWRPHDSQQKPLQPGSAKTRLADALKVAELPAGDKIDG